MRFFSRTARQRSRYRVVMVLERADSPPVPIELLAVRVNEYEVRERRPEIEVDVAEPDTVIEPM